MFLNTNAYIIYVYIFFFQKSKLVLICHDFACCFNDLELYIWTEIVLILANTLYNNK